jgi:hypothetical protein
MFTENDDHRILTADADLIIDECRKAALNWKQRKSEAQISKRSVKSISKKSNIDTMPQDGLDVLSYYI